MEDECCDICGDIGVVDAIITCCQCKIATEHLYCMRNYSEEAPTVWLCEECEPNNKIASPTSGVKEGLPKALISKASSRVQHVTAYATCPTNKLSNDSRRGCFYKEKKVETGKVRYLPAEEAIRLSSGAKFESSTKLNFGSSPGSSKTLSLISERTPVKPKAIYLKFSSQEVLVSPTLGNSGYMKTPRHGNMQIDPMVQQQGVQLSKELKDGKFALPSPMKEHIHKGQSVDAIKPVEETETIETKTDKATNEASCASPLIIPGSPCMISGGTICSNEEPRTLDADNTNVMKDLPEVEMFFPSDPALDASWRGSFDVLNNFKPGEFSDGIQAHPPSKVRRKVYEFSKQMPQVLHFELIPRHNLCTDLAQDDYLDKNDIGLYFFPSNSERFESYISLLEFIGMRDLVMQSYIDDVELLVLTSRLLHVDSQRWNGKYFLWGVFRRVKKDTAACKDNKEFTLLVSPPNDTYESHDAGDNNGVVDMEIDMVGGESVGRVDLVISKERVCGSSRVDAPIPLTLLGSDVKFPVSRNMDFCSQLSSSGIKRELCNDIPPGFEEIYVLKVRDNTCKPTVSGGQLLKVDGKAISLAKENKSLKRVSEFRLQKPTKDSDSPGSSPMKVKSEVI